MNSWVVDRGSYSRVTASLSQVALGCGGGGVGGLVYKKIWGKKLTRQRARTRTWTGKGCRWLWWDQFLAGLQVPSDNKVDMRWGILVGKEIARSGLVGARKEKERKKKEQEGKEISPRQKCFSLNCTRREMISWMRQGHVACGNEGNKTEVDLEALYQT